MSVAAAEKSTGLTKNITITNDKGRLSKDEIESMLKDAETFKEEDRKNGERIEAKNSLESYLFNVKSTISDNKDIKMDEDDKTTITEAVDEGITWLDANQMASKEEYVAKNEDVSKVVNPVLAKAYGGSSPNEGAPAESDFNPYATPDIQEVD
jgi:L1 cell adhesion molecule like protein